MIWVGIGLIIIGLGLFALTALLVKPLRKITSVLNDVKKTTKDLPETVNELTTRVNSAFDTGLHTLKQVNTQLGELTPIFHIIGDVGRTTKQLSSNMAQTVNEFEQKGSSNVVGRKNLEGLYGAITLGIMVFQKVRNIAKERKVVDNQ